MLLKCILAKKFLFTESIEMIFKSPYTFSFYPLYSKQYNKSMKNVLYENKSCQVCFDWITEVVSCRCSTNVCSVILRTLKLISLDSVIVLYNFPYCDILSLLHGN